MRGIQRGQGGLRGFIRNRRPGLPPPWKEEKRRNAEEAMSAGGGRAAAKRVAGSEGGRGRRGGRRSAAPWWVGGVGWGEGGRREMQRNASLLCDDLTPANQDWRRRRQVTRQASPESLPVWAGTYRPLSCQRLL